MDESRAASGVFDVVVVVRRHRRRATGKVVVKIDIVVVDPRVVEWLGKPLKVAIEAA